MRRGQLSGTIRCAQAFGLPALAFALVLLGAIPRAAGAAQTDYTHFDHQTTGFPLDGQHLNLRCEQCHLRGIFTGTSKQCSTCHIQGNPLSAVLRLSKSSLAWVWPAVTAAAGGTGVVKSEALLVPNVPTRLIMSKRACSRAFMIISFG